MKRIINEYKVSEQSDIEISPWLKDREHRCHEEQYNKLATQRGKKEEK